MRLEDQRFLHEDLERLEQGIADRLTEEPRQIRELLRRDHQIAGFLDRIQEQSKRLVEIYKDAEGLRRKEIQSISTGNLFDEFYSQLDGIKDFHRRYPNEPVENLERAYQKRPFGEPDPSAVNMDSMFTGEEAHGRFLDLTAFHERYLNLPGIRRLSYLQYLNIFDSFTLPECAIRRQDKMTDGYFNYVADLASYLESFIRRTQPLDDFEKLSGSIDEEFSRRWKADDLPGWTQAQPSGPRPMEIEGEGIWCPDCEKDFSNENVYKNHLSGKKHKRAAEARKAREASGENMNGTSDGPHQNQGADLLRLKERAVAEREFRVQKLTQSVQQKREDTHTTVERKAGMTERERMMEHEALFGENSEAMAEAADNEDDEDGEEKIHNPLKLPTGWDGKPIPYWLYKLHGLGNEFSCEICGNFVYMGRRAFDKHFNEARHIYGLKCLGINNTTLFREITGIDEALNLWDKMQRDKKKEKTSMDNVVQMEDADGNVMPEKVYLDLQKQGLL